VAVIYSPPAGPESTVVGASRPLAGITGDPVQYLARGASEDFERVRERPQQGQHVVQDLDFLAVNSVAERDDGFRIPLQMQLP
jgi:hypothetical protein